MNKISAILRHSSTFVVSPKIATPIKSDRNLEAKGLALRVNHHIEAFARLGFKMYPLTLLKMAYNQPMLVELKNGETYNGNLASCDTWMNLHLRGEVICTSKDGENFWKMPEVFIRGSMIKYLRLPDDVMDIAKQQEKDGGKRRRRDDRDRNRQDRG